MSTKLINILVAVVVLGWFVIGSTIARSNVAGSLGGQAYMTKVDFDQAFADATAMPRRDNTPANRERLREAGWKRIIGSR
jgi:hypothetical protein